MNTPPSASTLINRAQDKAASGGPRSFERAFKLEELIQLASWGELRRLLDCYTREASTLVPPAPEGDSRCAFKLLGLYSSGLFLAHWLNLYHDHALRPVWAFKLFPYVQVHPLHHHIDVPDAPAACEILVCDEAIKTAYTVAALDSHVRRAGHRNCSLSIYALFRWRNYRILELPNAYVGSLYKADADRQHVLNRAGETATDIDSEAWIDACFQAAEFATADKARIYAGVREAIVAMRTALREDANAAGPYDLTYFLASSHWMTLLAVFFADHVLEIVDTQKAFTPRICLFAPSPEGRTLQMMVATALKWRLRDWDSEKSPEIVLRESDLAEELNRRLAQRKSGKTENLLIATDLCLSTGFTLAEGVSRITNSSQAEQLLRRVAEGEVDSVRSLFDRILTIETLMN